MNSLQNSNKLTRDQAFELLSNLRLDTVKDQADLLPPEELKQYLTMHLDRFLLTLELIKKYGASLNQPKVLDIGSFPYFLPVLLIETWKAQVVGIDLPKEAYWPGRPYKSVEKSMELKSGSQSYQLMHRLLNIEQDDLPDKNKFDVALFTEVLEHLLFNPHQVVTRINQALKTGGLLILTTPNAKYLMKLLATIKGSNVNEKYNLTLGAYGRHNREYILSEALELLEAHNFKILSAQLVNFPKKHLSTAGQLKYRLIESLTNLPGLSSRKEGIVLVAQKIGPTTAKEPSSIFRR